MKILNSLQIGSGNRNIIILHGFLGMGDNWRGFAKKLDGVKFKINLVDQRNHGKSFWHEDMNYDYMAKDLLLFCDSKKIDKSTIIGEILAKRAKEKKINEVFFDRGSYKYHGRVKMFADTLRKNGLKF